MPSTAQVRHACLQLDLESSGTKKNKWKIKCFSKYMIQTQTYGKWSQKAPSCCGSHTLVLTLNNTDASSSGHRDSVARTQRGWIWCLLEGNTDWSQLDVCVCVCVDSRQSLNICSPSPATSSIHFLILSLIHCVSGSVSPRSSSSSYCSPLSPVVSISSSSLHPSLPAHSGGWER